jgi:hypothetical protein
MAMQSAMKGADAYGLVPSGQRARIYNPMLGMPQAQTFAGGVRGYSSLPLFQQAVQELETIAPNYMDAYREFYPVSDPDRLPYYYPSDGSVDPVLDQASGAVPVDYGILSGFFGGNR